MARALLVLPKLWSAYHSLSERKGRIQGSLQQMQNRKHSNTEGQTPQHD